MTSRSLGLALAIPLLLAAPLGCPADSDEPKLIEGACGEIIEACHTKDDGVVGSPVNECHNTAHEENEADCSKVHAMCIETCNAAPDVATGEHESTDTEHDSDDHGESETATSGHDDTEATSGSGPTTTSSPDEPSCAALGAGCHEAEDEFGMMCHEVGHAENEAECAEIWDACREACGF